MKQLTINDIFNCVNRLQKSGMNFNDIMALPIYLGNDDELNGVHNGWYCELIDSEDTEDVAIDLINSDSCTTKLKGKAILIS